MSVEATQTASEEEQEYQSILNAVLETPRGRWFIDEFRSRNRTADTNELLTAINSLKTVADDDSSATVNILRRELQEMSATIQQTRSAVASIKPEEAGDNRIMAATEELDAIISATERATSEILTGAERIQEVTEKLRDENADDDLCDEIESHATAIFMACSFQDITGQRTTRVVQVLKYLEHRVNFMIELWGQGEEGAPTVAPLQLPETKDPRADSHLLNGPQSEDKATSQSAVDAMMNEQEDTSSISTEQATKKEPQASAVHVDLDDIDFLATAGSADCEQGDIDALFD
jgi:chemotaxis protein CheZ